MDLKQLLETPILQLENCSTVDSVAKDVYDIISSEIPSDVTDEKHVNHRTVRPHGVVKQWSLFNRSGNTSNPIDDVDTVYANKFFNEKAKNIEKFIMTNWPLTTTCRINLLGPYSYLEPHKVPTTRNNVSKARFHLPIITNENALVQVQEECCHFKKGIVYYFNNGLVHTAKNDSNQYRYHIIWDSIIDEALLEYISSISSRIDSINSRLFNQIYPEHYPGK